MKIEKLIAKAKASTTDCQYIKDVNTKLFAAKSVGEVEGYLNCLKDNNLITNNDYAILYEKMTKIWNRI